MALEDALIAKLRGVCARFDELTARLSDPAVISRQTEFRKLSKEHSDLSELVEKFRRYETIGRELGENEELAKDPEMRELARDEIDRLRVELPPLEERIKVLLLPKDPNDEKNILLEIRGG